MPLVSIVIPIYNAEKYIEQCLNSVISQTYTNWELICVDDGSIDCSRTIIDEYCQKDYRIQCVVQKNQYAGVARNNGLKVAKGKYIVFWDADDYFENDILEKLVDKAEKTDADIVICGSDTYYQDTQLSGELYGAFNKEICRDFSVFSVDDIPDKILQLTAGWAWDKLYNLDFIKREKIEFQNTRVANDQLFTDIAYVLANRITYVDDVLVHHRVNTGESLADSKMKTWMCSFDMLNMEYSELHRRGKYEQVKTSFENRFVNYISWYIDTIKDYQILKEYIGFAKKVVVEMNINCNKICYYEDYWEDIFKAVMEHNVDEAVFELLKNARRLLANYENVFEDYKKAIKHCDEIIAKNDDYRQEVENTRIWELPDTIFEVGDKVLIYGYGKMGKGFVKQVKGNDIVELIGVVDKREISINGVKTYKVDEINNLKMDKVLVAVYDKSIACEIRDDLLVRGIDSKKIVWIDYKDSIK